MKSPGLILSSILVAGSQTVKASENIVLVNKLGSIGIQQSAIEMLFTNQVGIKLNPHELLKVEEDEEGNNFKFETLDHHSIIVPIAFASGGFNKKSLPVQSFEENE